MATLYNIQSNGTSTLFRVNTGSAGPAGPKGEKGEKGDIGPQGLTGEQGLKGDTGLGIASITTTQSVVSGEPNTITITLTDDTSKSFSVYNGEKGDKGDTGSKGDTGEVGPKGDKGDIGLTGPKGDTGEQGIQGEKGDAGVGISSISVVESSADGGINTVTVNLSDDTSKSFTIKNGSKGSKGDTGEQGIQGEQGPKGDTGAQGPKGDTGPQGPQGEKGDKGENTAAITSVSATVDENIGTPSVECVAGGTSTDRILTFNFHNLKGEKGEKGDTGEQGPQGVQGDQGIQGIQGETGPKGDTGEKGDKGDTGEQGPKGDTGAQGEKGADGVGFGSVNFTTTMTKEDTESGEPYITVTSENGSSSTVDGKVHQETSLSFKYGNLASSGSGGESTTEMVTLPFNYYSATSTSAAVKGEVLYFLNPISIKDKSFKNIRFGRQMGIYVTGEGSYSYRSQIVIPGMVPIDMYSPEFGFLLTHCDSFTFNNCSFEDCSFDYSMMNFCKFVNCKFIGTTCVYRKILLFEGDRNKTYGLGTTVDLSGVNTDEVSDMTSMFSYCSNLTNLTLGENWGSNSGVTSFSLSSSTLLTHDSCLDVFNKLATKTSSATLKLSATTKALMSDAEIKIATDKGWTVS